MALHLNNYYNLPGSFIANLHLVLTSDEIHFHHVLHNVHNKLLNCVSEVYFTGNKFGFSYSVYLFVGHLECIQDVHTHVMLLITDSGLYDTLGCGTVRSSMSVS